MIVVFFVNGLAFFVMALAISLEARRPSKLKLAGTLWLLAVFAFLRSLSNWMGMFSADRGQAALTSSNFPPPIVRVLMLVSYLFLIQFGTETIRAANQRYRWLRWIHLPLISFWLLAVIQTVYPSSRTSADWLLAADVWARYFLYVPGAALSGLAIFFHYRVLREMRPPHIARNCLGAAVFFGLQAILAGLYVAPAPYFPASFLNESSFLAGGRVPAEIFRTITTLAITYFITRTLEVFRVEQNHQLEVATQQRLQAQQEALEAQRQLREEMEQWNKQLEDMVNTIAVAIGQPLELKEILDIALHKALELPGLDSGGVLLVDDRTQELVLVAHHGLSQEFVRAVERLPLGKGILGWQIAPQAVVSGELIIVENFSEIPRPPKMAVISEEGIRFHASVPLRSRGRILGVMNLSSKSSRSFTPQEVIFLNAIGQQIGVAIENARLYEQVQSMAALEERDRLGRELHDGLAQALSYVQFKSNALERLLASGRVAQAQAELQEIQEVAREVCRDVRESILGLRTTVTPGAGIVPTLTEYLHRFSQQSGIRARLVMSDDVKMEFAPAAEIQFLRIIQEALTNVRKHSQASRAWVRFEAGEAGIVITVEDDGRGFDPSLIGQDGREHFGLQTMRERAESVGGIFHVSTQPGQGTRLTVQLPLSH